MFRKIYFKLSIATAVVVFAASAVLAQTAPVSGSVVLKKADGTTTPVEGALVEVFRTDIKASFPSAKTNKKGEFSFAGLPLGATFALSVSAAGAKGEIFPNIKAGQSNFVIDMQEGDGKRWTEDEVRQALAGAAGGAATGKPAEMTAEQKKQQAEYEKKVAEVASKNKDIENKNAIIQKALEEGNTAFNAKNYDVAVVKYTEGVDADPNYVGSAPVLLNNKGTALRSRAVDTYNASVKLSGTEKLNGMNKAKKDFADSVEAFNRSFTILQGAQSADIADPKTHEAAKAQALRGAREALRLMAQTQQVDEAVIPAAAALIPASINIETETAKKAESQLILADVYRVAGSSDKAIVEYKKVLETSPDNIEALAGLGLSLVNSGYMDNDKAKFQEGANYLQRFASLAPDGHKYKDDALGLIETLKAEQNVTPQKTAPARRKN